MSALAYANESSLGLPLMVAMTKPVEGLAVWDDNTLEAALARGEYYDPSCQMNVKDGRQIIDYFQPDDPIVPSTKCTGICGTGMMSDRDQQTDD